jgi:hypothetical protein
VDFTWLVPSSIYYIEENSKTYVDYVAVEKAKWPQNRGTYVCAPTHTLCVHGYSVHLGRTLRGQCHGGGVARPRCTESVTFGCGWPPFLSTCFSGIVYVRTGEAQFGGVPHVPVEPPRCQHATSWSGTRPNDMYVFVWAILLRSASLYGLN